MFVKQIAALTALAFGFIAFDTAFFFTFTKPCLPDRSEGMKAKSIELDKYLPFDENSAIVDVDSELKLSGDLPVIDGATALYPVYSAFVNSVYPEDSVEFDGSDFSADSKLQMRNTLKAYKSIVDGDEDIAICAAPSAEQLQYADENGVEMELVPIGREAFVFLVNGSNPVDDLTVQQIRDIYAGELTNWSQLGGKKLPINPLQRIEGSGSQTVMLAFVNGGEMRHNPLGAIGSPLGFSFRYYVEDVVEHGNVKMTSVNGVYPDKEHIADGSYPVVCDFYAVYDKANENPNIKPFIDWMLSDEGQLIVEETGYTALKK